MTKGNKQMTKVEYKQKQVSRNEGCRKGAEGLRKIVEGLRRIVERLWRVAEWSGNADRSQRSVELSVP